MNEASRIREVLKEHLENGRNFFKNGREEIAQRNITSLRIAGVGGFFITALLTLITPLILPDWKASYGHYGLIIALLIFGVVGEICYRKQLKSYYAVQAICVAFSVTVLVMLGYINACAYPDDPDFLLCSFFTIMPVIFILRPATVLVLLIVPAITVSLVGDVYLSARIAPFQSFSLLMSVILSVAVYIIVLNSRTGEFKLREHYLADSRTDLLTGLLNKRSYELLCTDMIDSMGSEKSCALFVMDVDKFKLFNDSYGHAKGDEVLNIVAQSIRECFRSNDKIGRIGGDEFSVFISTGGAKGISEEKAALICHCVERNSQARLGIKVSVSVGVADFTTGGITYLDAFKTADAALYSAKQDESKSFELRRVKK